MELITGLQMVLFYLIYPSFICPGALKYPLLHFGLQPSSFVPGSSVCSAPPFIVSATSHICSPIQIFPSLSSCLGNNRRSGHSAPSSGALIERGHQNGCPWGICTVAEPGCKVAQYPPPAPPLPLCSDLPTAPKLLVMTLGNGW